MSSILVSSLFIHLRVIQINLAVPDHLVGLARWNVGHKRPLVAVLLPTRRRCPECRSARPAVPCTRSYHPSRHCESARTLVRDQHHTVTAGVRLMIWLCVWLWIRCWCCRRLFTAVDDDVIFYSAGGVSFDRSAVGQVPASSTV